MIPIATIIKYGEKFVKNRLPLNGNKNPTNEKQAGQTPNMKPSTLPPIPDLTLGLQSMHWFFENRYSETNMPKRIENMTYNEALSGFWTMSANQI
jgi:hypothetical protein